MNRTEALLSEIRIGTRHRKDPGDISALARSIEEIGLLHPVVVTPDLELIAGRRRLEAVKKLGWDRVPVRMIDLKEIVRGEFAENALRKNFTPSEAVAIGKALEALEKQKAQERQKATRAKKGQKVGAGKLPTPRESSEHGRVRDKVAAVVGMSGTTYEKAKKVVEAAEADPEVNGPLVEVMDKTGKVDRAHRKLTSAGGASAAASPRTAATAPAAAEPTTSEVQQAISVLLAWIATLQRAHPAVGAPAELPLDWAFGWHDAVFMVVVMLCSGNWWNEYRLTHRVADYLPPEAGGRYYVWRRKITPDGSTRLSYDQVLRGAQWMVGDVLKHLKRHKVLQKRRTGNSFEWALNHGIGPVPV
jgi:ParB family chromosome partitioning protein